MSGLASTPLELSQLKLGYLPLVDSIAPLWAWHKGYFKRLGLDVELVQETSWSTLRDRLAFGVLDAAHCLSPIVASACSAADDIGIPLLSALVLSHNTAKISLSRQLVHDLHIHQQDLPHQSAARFVNYLQQHPLKLAHVFPASLHHFTLREWLRLSNQDIAHNIRFATLPPHHMLNAVSQGLINGFCVGEPWNSVGEVRQISQIICHSEDVIPSIADKVLAVTQDWARQHPQTHQALVQAVYLAQQDLAHDSHMQEAYVLLKTFGIIEPHLDSMAVKNSIETMILHIHQHNMQPKASDFYWILTQLKEWLHPELNHLTFQHTSLQCCDLETYQDILYKI